MNTAVATPVCCHGGCPTNFFFAIYPIKKKATKLLVTPAMRLSSRLPPKIASLMKMPTAAPIPPTSGPKTTAKTAGTITGAARI